jgi:hypothetical protein
MIYKKIADFPTKSIGSYTGNELLLISDTVYNAKIKTSELKQFFLESASYIANSGNISIKAGINGTESVNFSSSVNITGDVSILGVLNVTEVNQINVSDLYVRDKLIVLNSSGSNLTATGSGITVSGSSGTVSSVLFDPALPSKWKIDGKQIVTVSDAQTLTNKVLNSTQITGSVTLSGSLDTFGIRNIKFTSLSGASPVVPLTNEYVLLNSSNGTASLSPCAGMTGRVITIKNLTPGDCMISASSGELIDRENSYTLEMDDAIQFIGSASVWYTFAYSPASEVIIT